MVSSTPVRSLRPEGCCTSIPQFNLNGSELCPNNWGNLRNAILKTLTIVDYSAADFNVK